MGVGKTTVGKALKNTLENSVHLDADWLWDFHPFNSSKEYKQVVYQNIQAVLNNFITFPKVQYIIFSWVMSPKMKARVLDFLKLDNVKVFHIILDADVPTLMGRWENNNEEWRRSQKWRKQAKESVISFQNDIGKHIDTRELKISEIVKEIHKLLDLKEVMKG